jgi:hypothetical protein
LPVRPPALPQPQDSALTLDFQPDFELLDVLPIVYMRPEQPANLARACQHAKQLRVANDRIVFAWW